MMDEDSLGKLVDVSDNEEENRKQKVMRGFIVDFITGLVKGALNNLNLEANCSGEWDEIKRVLEISIEIK
eukprot:CAMPEP_0197009314 /NCGR_PEP_ID=MMETSP1380-20130617/49588_1 /TAXON_ID=5936 /ORGANISM="Euplotes crassus, Strain CT5" /LENGTH=69 /DNA_ID=CAMNT_0042430475 /DNA_START=316 /DNA_END=524 /DNA_ORIENTATION=-